MRPSELNARFLVPKRGEGFDPPAFDTGLILIHRGAAHDPTLDCMLWDIPDDADGKYAKAFYKHRDQCPRCNEARMISTPDDLRL
jgi:hypothetical protein